VIRCSIRLSIEKPSEVERIIEEEKARIDAWYEKRKNNGDQEAIEKANALKKLMEVKE
jgi:hypothetical protein